jgi:diguanylate cyclase (GGDEF)-like protein
MREHQDLIARLHEQLRSQQLIAVQGQLDARERTLELERLRGEQALRSVEIDALERTRRWQGLALVALAAIGLLLVGWGARQYRQNRQLALQASIDPLTRVANRRAFLHRGQQLFAQHRGTQRPLSVLGIDLDLFKLVNDRYGHAAGDEVLVAVAGRMQSLLRQGEILGRLGGEEFAVLLPDIGPGEARRVAERLRVGIAALDFSDIKTDLGVTVSIGAATLEGHSHDSLDALMESADRRLYRAKAAGRDRIEDADTD